VRFKFFGELDLTVNVIQIVEKYVNGHGSRKEAKQTLTYRQKNIKRYIFGIDNGTSRGQNVCNKLLEQYWLWHFWSRYLPPPKYIVCHTFLFEIFMAITFLLSTFCAKTTETFGYNHTQTEIQVHKIRRILLHFCRCN